MHMVDFSPHLLPLPHLQSRFVCTHDYTYLTIHHSSGTACLIRAGTTYKAVMDDRYSTSRWPAWCYVVWCYVVWCYDVVVFWKWFQRPDPTGLNRLYNRHFLDST